MKHIITVSEMALNKLGIILKQHNKSASKNKYKILNPFEATIRVIKEINNIICFDNFE